MERKPSALPERRKLHSKVRKEYSYSTIVERKILPDDIQYIIISKNDLGLNLEILKEIINYNDKIKIKFLDWDSAIHIDSIFDEFKDIECFLQDDGMQMPRDYIDMTKLKKIKVTIPLNYLMWGVIFTSEARVYSIQIYNELGDYINPTSCNGNYSLSKKDLEKVKKIVLDLSAFKMPTDYDKVMIVSDYIQSKIQFIEGQESISNRGVFITPDFPNDYPAASLIESALNHHGKCVAIANLSTLLLNNPELNVQVETVHNNIHAWNRVLIDGKYYYFDNTWNITRSNNQHADALVALSFSSGYTLFGQETAKRIGSHEPYPTTVYAYNSGQLSEDDYKQSKYTSRFTYQKKPFFKSYKKNSGNIKNQT